MPLPRFRPQRELDFIRSDLPTLVRPRGRSSPRHATSQDPLTEGSHDPGSNAAPAPGHDDHLPGIARSCSHSVSVCLSLPLTLTVGILLTPASGEAVGWPLGVRPLEEGVASKSRHLEVGPLFPPPPNPVILPNPFAHTYKLPAPSSQGTQDSRPQLCPLEFPMTQPQTDRESY